MRLSSSQKPDVQSDCSIDVENRLFQHGLHNISKHVRSHFQWKIIIFNLDYIGYPYLFRELLVLMRF